MKAIFLQMICYSFSFMFFISFISKLFSFRKFVQSIHEFNIVTNRFIIMTGAIVILAVEWILAASFALRQFHGIAFLLTSLLMGFFIVLFIRSLRKKQSISCHCFGHQEKFTNLHFAIARNLTILVFSVLGLLWTKSAVNEGNGQLHLFFLLLSVALLFELTRSLRQYTKQPTA
jgi:hypothetical protein